MKSTHSPEELDLILSLSSFSHGCEERSPCTLRWLLAPLDISIKLTRGRPAGQKPAACGSGARVLAPGGGVRVSAGGLES